MVPDMSQEEVRRIIISDMVKKRNSIVPVIGEDAIIYKDKTTGTEIPFQEFIFNEFQKKYPHVLVDDAALTSMKERGYYGLSLLSQYYNEHGRFLDDFMDFVSKNTSCIKLKDEVLDFLVTFSCIKIGEPVANEIRTAMKYKKNIIPVTIDGKEVKWPRAFPDDLKFIRGLQFHDHKSDSYFEHSIDELCEKLTYKKFDDKY